MPCGMAANADNTKAQMPKHLWQREGLLPRVQGLVKLGGKEKSPDFSGLYFTS